MLYIPPINGDTGDPNRSYINANPALGIEGSIPDALAFEYFQREAIAVIVAGGLTPSNAILTQLRDAILALIASGAAPDATETVKGKVELATSAEALGGTDTTRAVTSAGLAGSKSYSANGYQKLPGGLILQWGVVASPTLTITWPIAFPANVYSIQATTRSDDIIINVGAPSLSGVTFDMDLATTGANTTTGGFYWFAIGN